MIRVLWPTPKFLFSSNRDTNRVKAVQDRPMLNPLAPNQPRLLAYSSTYCGTDKLRSAKGHLYRLRQRDLAKEESNSTDKKKIVTGFHHVTIFLLFYLSITALL